MTAQEILAIETEIQLKMATYFGAASTYLEQSDPARPEVLLILENEINDLLYAYEIALDEMMMGRKDVN